MRLNWLTFAALIGGILTRAYAHDTGHTEVSRQSPPAVPLPHVVEKRGPLKSPPALPAGDAVRTTGQGYWKFVAVTHRVLPIPAEAQSFLKGAHGTLIVDAERDEVYWGLEQVGWIRFSHQLTQSEVIKGDPVFARGNLHGADLLPQGSNLPLVAVADNLEGEVYLSDTRFAQATILDWPSDGPYKAKGEFHPTDVAFTGQGELYVTDGYGQAFFLPAHTAPLGYRGIYLGGKSLSQTPHGITYVPKDQSLLISARPEAQIKRWSLSRQVWTEVSGLPPGSTVCDVDLWGHYALAPCLNGPQNTPGPIYVINLKKKAIVSTLRPREDLGFTEAQHIHDAAWYFTQNGRRKELYVLFTNWNPGGIGALKLVAAP